jgi:hypothetical protein
MDEETFGSMHVEVVTIKNGSFAKGLYEALSHSASFSIEYVGGKTRRIQPSGTKANDRK